MLMLETGELNQLHGHVGTILHCSWLRALGPKVAARSQLLEELLILQAVLRLEAKHLVQQRRIVPVSLFLHVTVSLISWVLKEKAPLHLAAFVIFIEIEIWSQVRVVVRELLVCDEVAAQDEVIVNEGLVVGD